MRSLAAPCAALAYLFLAGFAHAEGAASSTPTPAGTPAPAPSTATGGAATATPPNMVIVPGDNEQPVLEPIPDARDTLGKHFLLGAGIGAKWPFGSLNDTQTQRSELGPGLALHVDLGVGLSRNVAFGAWGEFDDYSAPPQCPVCTATSFAVGPFLRYYVAQGTRFDPWGTLAIGLRRTNIDNGGSSSEHYFGAELLKLTLGGDWYASSNVAFGPYVEFDLGVYADRTIHTGLGTGLRFSLDLPGR